MRKVSRATRKLADIGSRRETFGREFLSINSGKFVTRYGMSTGSRVVSTVILLRDQKIIFSAYQKTEM